MPKRISIAALEGTRKRERPCKRWRDDVEDDFNIT
jgi:hypothetical protein